MRELTPVLLESAGWLPNQTGAFGVRCVSQVLPTIVTCLAITSLSPVQSMVGSFAISLVELGQADYALAVAGG